MTAVDVIVVVCDSPRHARGKVAKAGYFMRDLVDGGWHLRGGDRRRQWVRRIEKQPPGYSPGERVVDMMAKSSLPPRCKLCGAAVPKPPESLLNQLAALGKSQIRLVELRAGSI